MSNKRRRLHIDAAELEKLVNTVTPSTSHSKLFEVVAQVQALLTTSKPQSISASSLRDLDQVIHLTGIKYQYGSPDHDWFLENNLNKEAEIRHGCRG